MGELRVTRKKLKSNPEKSNPMKRLQRTIARQVTGRFLNIYEDSLRKFSGENNEIQGKGHTQKKEKKNKYAAINRFLSKTTSEKKEEKYTRQKTDKKRTELKNVELRAQYSEGTDFEKKVKDYSNDNSEYTDRAEKRLKPKEEHFTESGRKSGKEELNNLDDNMVKESTNKSSNNRSSVLENFISKNLRDCEMVKLENGGYTRLIQEMKEDGYSEREIKKKVIELKDKAAPRSDKYETLNRLYESLCQTRSHRNDSAFEAVESNSWLEAGKKIQNMSLPEYSLFCSDLQEKGYELSNVLSRVVDDSPERGLSILNTLLDREVSKGAGNYGDTSLLEKVMENMDNRHIENFAKISIGTKRDQVHMTSDFMVTKKQSLTLDLLKNVDKTGAIRGITCTFTKGSHDISSKSFNIITELPYNKAKQDFRACNRRYFYTIGAEKKD